MSPRGKYLKIFVSTITHVSKVIITIMKNRMPSTRIVNFMSPVAGVLTVGRG